MRPSITSPLHLRRKVYRIFRKVQGESVRPKRHRKKEWRWRLFYNQKQRVTNSTT